MVGCGAEEWTTLTNHLPRSLPGVIYSEDCLGVGTQQQMEAQFSLLWSDLTTAVKVLNGPGHKMSLTLALLFMVDGCSLNWHINSMNFKFSVWNMSTLLALSASELVWSGESKDMEVLWGLYKASKTWLIVFIQGWRIIHRPQLYSYFQHSDSRNIWKHLPF